MSETERYIISAEHANAILRHFEERPLKEAIKAGFQVEIPFEKEQTPEVVLKQNEDKKEKLKDGTSK